MMWFLASLVLLFVFLCLCVGYCILIDGGKDGRMLKAMLFLLAIGVIACVVMSCIEKSEDKQEFLDGPPTHHGRIVDITYVDGHTYAQVDLDGGQVLMLYGSDVEALRIGSTYDFWIEHYSLVKYEVVG